MAWTTAKCSGFADEVAAAIEHRFIKTGEPHGLTLTHACGAGDYPFGDERGMNYFAHDGLITKWLAGHVGESTRMIKLVNEGKIEVYSLPQGVMLHLYRQMAGKKIGVITKVGLDTFIDPRQDGGRMTPGAKDEYVKLVEFEGEEYLYFKPYHIDVAVFKGTTADEKGNITMDGEPVFLEGLTLATAVHNNGGIVIAQVQYLAKPDTLHPKAIKVPGVLVDYIVVASPERHRQTIGTYFHPAMAGDCKVPLSSLPSLPLDDHKVILRRALMELHPESTLNLGVGMPAGAANVANEEGVIDMVTFTTELGNLGGVPQGGADFPASINAEATIDHPSMFDFYDGGGLDMCIVGLAQVDAEGNLNVSKFGTKIFGPGGFINITVSAKKVVFVGSMTVGSKCEVKDGRMVIGKEGGKKKFVNKVDQITFSGKQARLAGKPVFYITERAVFSLEKEGLTLIEIAPGVDLEKDVLAAMEFMPRISPNLKEMPTGLFQPRWGELKKLITGGNASGEGQLRLQHSTSA